MKKAAAYARVSTQHQSKDTSIEAQLELIREFAKSRGIQIVEEFWDKDSGGKVSRKNFDRMIKKALSGEYDLIIVDKFDRFFREGVEDQRITKLLEEHGVHVIAVLEPVDPSTPAGWFARWIFSGMYEMQRRYIAEETKRKMRYAAKKGYWMGGIPPYGFKVIEVRDSEGKIRKKLVPDAEKAPIVERIFKMYAEGYGIRRIAEKLNQEGIKSPKGGEWTKSTLYDLLRNEKYIGIYTYAKGTKRNHHAKKADIIFVEGAIEPLISKELWDRVQARIKEKSFTRGIVRYRYILRGIAKCGICGAPLVGTPQRNGKVASYVCQAWKEKRAHEYLGISKKKLESFVLAYLETQLFSKPIDFEKLAEKLNELEELRLLAENKEYNQLLEQLNEIETQIRNIVDAIKSGLNSKVLLDELANLEERKKEMQLRMKHISTKRKYVYTAEKLRKRWEELRDLLKRADEESLEALFQTLLDRVIVYPNGYIEVHLKTERSTLLG